jgi:SAM-dependent methyltransferase
VSGAKDHWELVYQRRSPDAVSWYEPLPVTSMALIEACGLDRDAAIVDAGGGASRLAGKLLEAGYTDITVADLSTAALGSARAELGERAEEIEWVEADLRRHDFGRQFDLWHDRAVFQFMVDPADRAAYLAVLRRAIRPGGQLVIGTFGPQAPTRCSGLPVRRYGAEELAAELGSDFEPLGSKLQIHETPAGKEQQFLWARFRRIAS